MKTILTLKSSVIFTIFFIQGIMLLALNSYGSTNVDSFKKVNEFSLFRIQLSGLPNTLDEFVIYYQEGSTNGYDMEYDAYHLIGSSAPHISMDMDSFLLAINGIPAVVQTYTSNVLVTTPTTGNFTISATDIQGLPDGTCIFLKDLQTNSNVNLLLNSYSFNLSNTTTTSRFVLTITYNTLPITSNIIQPSCYNSNSGKTTVLGESGGPWNYTWKDTIGNTIKTSIGISAADSLCNLSSGGYKVEIISVTDACLRNEISFNISDVVFPLVAFTSPDTIVSSIGNNFSTFNLSTNCINYYWDFGDGIGVSSDFEPSYNYSVSGTYLTKLVGTSTSGCKDSTTKTIHIVDLSTNVISPIYQKNQLIDFGNNQFMLKLVQYPLNDLLVRVISLDGSESFQKHYNAYSNEILIDLNSLSVGLYVLQVEARETELLSSKIYIKK